MCRCKAQQSGDLLSIGEIFADALLQHAAELAPELRVLVLFVRREVFEQRVSPRQWIVKIVADVLVEFSVLLVADFVLRPRPQGRSLVDRFLLGELLILALLP